MTRPPCKFDGGGFADARKSARKPGGALGGAPYSRARWMRTLDAAANARTTASATGPFLSS